MKELRITITDIDLNDEIHSVKWAFIPDVNERICIKHVWYTVVKRDWRTVPHLIDRYTYGVDIHTVEVEIFVKKENNDD